MAQPNPLDNLRNLVRRGGTPVTNTILAVNVVLLILMYSLPVQATEHVLENLVVSPDKVLAHPWSLLLYPLLPSDPITLLFMGFAFWQFAGSLERSWGSNGFILTFGALCVISALSVLLGGRVLGLPSDVAGFLLPLAGVVIAFCMLNPGGQISFWFIPIPNRWIIVITFALVWMLCGGRLVGLFAEGGPLVAFLYVKYGRAWRDIGVATPRSRGNIIDLEQVRRRRSNVSYLDGSRRRSPLDIAGRWQDHKEQKRLEKLLRNSGISDPDDRRDERGKR